jgi:two-component sensor histidine kinase
MAQELRHRVRNNLQLVHGMISKQLHVTTDVSGKAGLSAISRRIIALAQVYDHLLGIGLNRTIDFGGYLSSLCSGIESLQMTQTSDVALICNSEHVFLDVDSVTTLGLIISEMISSSYEHAFPDGRGTITVSLSRSRQNDEATIFFSDDGVGFIEDGNSKRHGLGLVKRLMQQLSGSALLRSDHGSEWTLTFPVPPLPAKVAVPFYPEHPKGLVHLWKGPPPARLSQGPDIEQTSH